MTTEREHGEAKKLTDKLYPNVSSIDKGKRLKSLSEMNEETKLKFSKKSKPNIVKSLAGGRRKKKWRPLLYLCVLFILSVVGFGIAVEISCYVNGDPTPWREWQVRYEFSTWTDAGSNQNCRFNTREQWIDSASNWMSGLPMYVNFVWQSVREWFESLREGQQIDKTVIDGVESFTAWVKGLSLNQKLVIGVFSATTLGFLFFLIPVFRSLRRWIRRRRIPKEINLHLDRDS